MGRKVDVSAALARVVGPPERLDVGSLVGLEHEYTVRDETGRSVDFRRLIHQLGWGKRSLDPSDPNARRLTSGAVLTCDDAEAEIAIPPVDGGPGFASRIVTEAHRTRAELERRLPAGHRLDGFSTHVSVSVSDGETAEACARRYTVTFAPALMLLMDRAGSPGLLVRPRPGRLELGGEYVSGAALHAAVTFALGSVVALAASLRASRPLGVPDLSGDIRAADTRYGWFVGRRAFGDDLYRSGRAARLPIAPGASGGPGRTRGDTTTAQEQLAAGWKIARAALLDSGAASSDAVALTDRIVSGSLPIPLEGRLPQRRRARPRPPAGDSPHGQALEVWVRGGFGLAPVMLTWDVAVFLLSDTHSARRAFVSIPGRSLGRFLRALDNGELDRLFTDCVARRHNGNATLSRPGQTREPGVWDAIGPRIGLVAPEREPARSVRVGAASAASMGGAA